MREMRLRLAGLALMSLTLFVTPAVAELELRDLDGEWRQIEGPSNAERVAAIESAIAELSWVMRTMAAPILKRTTTPPERYEFDVASDYPHGIALAQRDEDLRPMLLDGRERHFTDQGDGEFSTRSQRHPDAIETRWKHGQAHGSTTFRLADDGSTLVVESLLQVTALSGVEPIRYETRFTRTPDVASKPE